MCSPVIPSQSEVDSVASFVQAVSELEAEPFFSKDEPRGLSHAGNMYTFRFGDRFHFRSALITFRRIWMIGEAENFGYVCNIMLRYLQPPVRDIVIAFRNDVREAENSRCAWPKDIGMIGSDLINLWLNTVFAHSGLRGKGPSRQQFDQCISAYGAGAVEYLFRHLVFQIGLGYRNVAKVARPLLAKWNSEFNLSPSFALVAAFGTKRRKKTKEGDVILRQSSSEHFSEESFEQRFTRILGRQNFGCLKNALSILEFSERQLSKVVLKYESFEQIVSESDYELQLVPKMESKPKMDDEMKGFCGLFEPNYPWISGLQYSDSAITTDEDGLRLLNALLTEFREQIMRE